MGFYAFLLDVEGLDEPLRITTTFYPSEILYEVKYGNGKTEVCAAHELDTNIIVAMSKFLESKTPEFLKENEPLSEGAFSCMSRLIDDIRLAVKYRSKVFKLIRRCSNAYLGLDTEAVCAEGRQLYGT